MIVLPAAGVSGELHGQILDHGLQYPVPGPETVFLVQLLEAVQIQEEDVHGIREMDGIEGLNEAAGCQGPGQGVAFFSPFLFFKGRGLQDTAPCDGLGLEKGPVSRRNHGPDLPLILRTADTVADGHRPAGFCIKGLLQFFQPSGEIFSGHVPGHDEEFVAPVAVGPEEGPLVSPAQAVGEAPEQGDTCFFSLFGQIAAEAINIYESRTGEAAREFLHIFDHAGGIRKPRLFIRSPFDVELAVRLLQFLQYAVAVDEGTSADDGKTYAEKDKNEQVVCILPGKRKLKNLKNSREDSPRQGIVDDVPIEGKGRQGRYRQHDQHGLYIETGPCLGAKYREHAHELGNHHLPAENVLRQLHMIRQELLQKDRRQKENRQIQENDQTIDQIRVSEDRGYRHLRLQGQSRKAQEANHHGNRTRGPGGKGIRPHLSLQKVPVVFVRILEKLSSSHKRSTIRPLPPVVRTGGTHFS